MHSLAQKGTFVLLHELKKQNIHPGLLLPLHWRSGSSSSLGTATLPHQRQPTEQKRFVALEENPRMFLQVDGYHHETHSATPQNL